MLYFKITRMKKTETKSVVTSSKKNELGDYKIEGAGSSDLSLILDCWPKEWGELYSQTIVRITKHIIDGKIWIVKSNNNVAGWLIWDDNHVPGSLYLKTVCVNPKFQRKGLMTLLVANAIKFASEKGFRQILLDVYEDSFLISTFLKEIGAEQIAKINGLYHPDKTTLLYAIRPKSNY